jgi:hypothetical protein
VDCGLECGKLSKHQPYKPWRRGAGSGAACSFASISLRFCSSSPISSLTEAPGTPALMGLDELAQVALDPGEFRFVPRFLCILPCGKAVEFPLKLRDESYELQS